MSNCNYMVSRLPDVEIYGGDTSPWTVNLFHEDGTPYTYNELFGGACIFTVQQFGVISASDQDPLIIKRIPFLSDSDNENVSLKIQFTVSDTISLHGKYIYQIEVITGQINTTYQGYLRVVQNINR